MKTLIRNLYYKYRWARQPIIFFVKLSQQANILLISDIRQVRKVYFAQNSRYPNLENPELFSEKILWLKLHIHSELHEQCADKIRVREYVSSILGNDVLIPCLGTADRLNRSLIQQIPESTGFFVKTNHGSSGGVAFNEKSEVNYDELDAIMNHHMARNHYALSREKQYKSIKPRILVEQLLQENGQSPMDYKIFCFNGVAKFIQVDIDRHTNHSRNIYDRNWELIPATFYYKNGRNIEKPQRLMEMLAMSEQLAQEFYFVRVDFYALGNQIYFGEMTFHPESGCKVFTPLNYEKLFGSYLTLPCKE